jgi:group I intron endonuclease
MRASGVYAILNLVNDKIYIGSARYIKDRLSWHHKALENNKHHSKLLQRAWFKYGEDSFIFFVLEYTDNLIEREQYWLDRFISYNVDCGYNHYPIAGSPAKTKHSEETKAKIGAAGKGRKMSAETLANMSKAQLNRSPEWRANHSAAMKKRVFTPEHRQKLVEANARVKARKLLTKD